MKLQHLPGTTPAVRAAGFLLALAGLGLSPALQAQGIFESVELVRKEPELLIEPADQLAEQFRRRSMLLDDEEVVSLVRRIGQDLAPEPTDDYIDYRFFVLRDPTPSAFSLPNGHVYVHSGMLASLENESQLAAVLAHEILHVAGHHSILQRRDDVRTEIVSGLANLFTRDTLGDGVAASSVAFLGDVMAEYGQLGEQYEVEAILRTPLLLEQHGYDPDAPFDLLEVLTFNPGGQVHAASAYAPRLSTFWTTGAAVEAVRTLRPDVFVRDEPADANVAGIADMPSAGRELNRFEQLGLRLGKLAIRDLLRDDFPYAALLVGERLIERHPAEIELRLLKGDAYLGLLWRSDGTNLEGLDFNLGSTVRMVFGGEIGDNPLTLFTQGMPRVDREQMVQSVRALADEDDISDTELYALRSLERNMASARDTYAAIIDTDPDYTPTYRSLGELNELLGMHREAAAAYLDYLRRAPDAEDRQLIVSRLAGIRDQLQQ